MKTYRGEFQNLKRVIHNLRGKKDNNANNARPIYYRICGWESIKFHQFHQFKQPNYKNKKEETKKKLGLVTKR